MRKGLASERFEADLILGHKGVTAVVVPFNPEEVWKCGPVRLAGRRHGWLVKGTANGVSFDGYIGERWGRFFIMLPPAILAEAKVEPGDVLTMLVEPAATPAAAASAWEQSKLTTQPKTARPDAIQLDSAPKQKPKR